MWTKLKAQFLRRQSIGTIIIGVTGAVLALQWSGTLQLLESAVLDRWFHLRPLETGESRVVIVTIDEPDISRLGRWPMSDATLAKLLEKLKQQQPTAIGLDLYRNLPVEPGHQELLKVVRMVASFGLWRMPALCVMPKVSRSTTKAALWISRYARFGKKPCFINNNALTICCIILCPFQLLSG